MFRAYSQLAESWAPQGEADGSSMLLEAFTDGIIAVDTEWRVRWVNAVAAHMLRITAEHVAGSLLWELNPDLQGSAFGRAFQRAMEEGKAASAEAFIPGSKAWFEARAFPTADGLLITCRDVTARVNATHECERLLESEARSREDAERAAARITALQSLTSRLAPALTLREVAEVIMAAGSEAIGARAASLGVPSDDGRVIHMVAFRGFSASVENHYRVVPVDAPLPLADSFRMGRPRWLHSTEELQRHYPDLAEEMGEEGHVAVACLPLRVHRQVIGALAISFAAPRTFSQAERSFIEAVADQCALALERARAFERERTMRRESEAAEKRSRFLADASRVLGASLDYDVTLETIARLAVPAFADWCAVDMLEPDGSIRRLAIEHQDPRKLALVDDLARRYPTDLGAAHGLGAVLRTGNPEWVPHLSDELLAAVTHDAEHLELSRKLGLRSYVCVPLKARGRTLGALSLVFAESGRTYGEADYQLTQDLARQAGLAVDNALLYRESREAVRLRDEFLSVASHELKTPLTPLQLKLQSLVRDLESPVDPARLRQNADVVQRQVRRLASLIDGLLDVSRISAGRMELELEELDLSALVREVATRFEQEAARMGSSLHVHAPEATVGRWDRLRLEQVVTNLVSNAIKYGAGKPIHLEVGAEGAQVSLRVRDQGIGIAPEDLARIFDRFERAVSGRNYGGLGLGLYITRRIVEALGGTVSVESAPGVGATFLVELPASGRTA